MSTRSARDGRRLRPRALAAVLVLAAASAATAAALQKGPVSQTDVCLAMVEKNCSLALECPLTPDQRAPLLETFGQTMAECRQRWGSKCQRPEPLCGEKQFKVGHGRKCLDAYRALTCDSRVDETTEELPECLDLCPHGP
jgi:hypothetical protein